MRTFSAAFVLFEARMTVMAHQNVDSEFFPASYPEEAYSYQALMAKFGVSKRDAKKAVAQVKRERVVLSETHQVAITDMGNGVVHLSIKRRDKSVIDDRTELAAIGRVLCPDRVCLELFPAEDRLVDTANQYHLFAIPVAEMRELVTEEADWAFPPHLGDWRELYTWLRATYGDREAALVVHSPERSLTGAMLIAPANARFPFGFGGRLVTSESRGGAMQRPFQAANAPATVAE